MLEAESANESGRRRSTFYVSLSDAENPTNTSIEECNHSNKPALKSSRKVHALAGLFRSPSGQNLDTATSRGAVGRCRSVSKTCVSQTDSDTTASSTHRSDKLNRILSPNKILANSSHYLENNDCGILSSDFSNEGSFTFFPSSNCSGSDFSINNSLENFAIESESLFSRNTLQDSAKKSEYLSNQTNTNLPEKHSAYLNQTENLRLNSDASLSSKKYLLDNYKKIGSLVTRKKTEFLENNYTNSNQTDDFIIHSDSVPSKIYLFDNTKNILSMSNKKKIDLIDENSPNHTQYQIDKLTEHIRTDSGSLPPIKPLLDTANKSGSLFNKKKCALQENNSLDNSVETFRIDLLSSKKPLIDTTKKNGFQFNQKKSDSSEKNSSKLTQSPNSTTRKYTLGFFDNRKKTLNKTLSSLDSGDKKISNKNVLSNLTNSKDNSAIKRISMSSLESTEQLLTDSNVSYLEKSNKCVTLPNNLSARMCLDFGNDTGKHNRKALSKPREIALSPHEPPKSQSCKLAGFSFIRRTHSTKLTRSPSLLKALTSKCVDHAETDVCGTTVSDRSREHKEENRRRLLDDEDQAVLSDTSYEKACRRGSAPTTPVLGGRPSGAQLDITPSRIVNFFSKRSFRSNPLKRTKSVTKLERARRPGADLEGQGGRLRTSRSHESLLSGHSAMTTLELGSSPGSVEIKALHPSVLGKQHCFQVTLSSDQKNPRYFSCRSQDERDKWVYSLRKSVQPDVEHTRRTDNSLKLWILEAKGIPNKKRYYCELRLDETLYAVTSTKLKTDLCFWGEHFDFPNLPSINYLYIHLFREGERKKRKNIYVGQVKIPITDITSRYLTEKWFPIDLDKSVSKEIPSLRIKCRFQSIDILPVKVYSEFLDYLKSDYRKVCEILEPVIGVKAKEDIATSLVLAMQSEGLARQFLADIVMMDILRVDDQRLTFRGNSLATKAMEAYLKLTGDKYLQDTLGSLVADVLSSQLDCEVDPLKVVSVGSLEKQQQNLRSAVQKAWNKILESHVNFPLELRECFATFRERLIALDREDISDNLISASIFLRFLCPAILSPSLFNITHEYPNEKAARNLTLIAKTLQTLANFTRFQGKENFMEFMNDFLEREAPSMKEFLRNICARDSDREIRRNVRRDSSVAQFEFDGYIDLGKQLSILSTLLKECLSKVAPGKVQELKPLEDVLETLHQNYCKQYIRQNSSPVHEHCNDNIFIFNDPTVHVSNTKLNGSQPQLSTNASNFNINTHTKPMNQSLTHNNLVIPTEGNLDNRHSTPIVQNKLLLNCSTLNYDNKKIARPATYASTLPRNTYGNSLSVIHNTNNIQDFLIEPANAFVSKSPTPKNVSRKIHGSYNNVNGTDNLNHDRHNGSDNGENSPNLDDISDLLHYVDEAEDLPNNKGSNVSISQLSNVASSGYQSFAYSQSSSPVDLTINNNTNGLKFDLNGAKCHLDKNKLMKKASLDNKYDVPRYAPNGQKYINSKTQALAFANPVYSMEYAPKQQLESSSSDEHLNHSEVKQIIQVENALRHSSSNKEVNRYNNYMDETSCPIRKITNVAQPRTNPLLAYHRAPGKNNYQTQKVPDLDYNIPQQNIGIVNNHVTESFDNRVYHKPQFDNIYEKVYLPYEKPNDERFDSKSNLSREKHFRRLSLESARDLSDSSSETDEIQQYHTTGRHRKNHRGVEHYEREIERLQTSVDQLRHKLEHVDLGSGHDITQPEGESKMKAIIARLITVEEELRKEQQKMSMALSHKQRVIEAQEHRIAALDATNNRLLSALSTLKERYLSGVVSNSSSTTVVSNSDPNENTLLSDLCDMKTSTC